MEKGSQMEDALPWCLVCPEPGHYTRFCPIQSEVVLPPAKRRRGAAGPGGERERCCLPECQRRRAAGTSTSAFSRPQAGASFAGSGGTLCLTAHSKSCQPM
ncbi:UNVERIFIED_CONTAM: hypothetical protein FKN15_056090 [Acipenser sinensis]